MPTEKQLQASRTNGSRSRGPTTPEGKKNTARNAYRHGLHSETVVLEGEAEDRFRALLADLYAEYQPSTQTELLLVETMAAARPAPLRVWGAQKTALDRDARPSDPGLGPKSVRSSSPSAAATPQPVHPNSSSATTSPSTANSPEPSPISGPSGSSPPPQQPPLFPRIPLQPNLERRKCHCETIPRSD